MLAPRKKVGTMQSNHDKSRRQGIRQIDVKRCVQGVVSGGLYPSRVEIEGNKIIIYAQSKDGKNEIVNDLDLWRVRNGSRSS